MNFSSETILGLKRLCNPSLVNDQHFNELVDSCIRAVQTDELANKNKSTEGKLDVIKVAYASLTVLLTEAARHGVDSDILKDILEGYNLNQDRISSIVETYGKNKLQVERKLMRIGTSLPHIVEIHWRMDYTIKSNCNKQYIQPFFHIQLVTITSNNNKKVIRFVCSVQNLEELVFQLKTATRHMNKLVTGALK
ncbi:COMM domain-containing protein 3 [Planococcus citri]|uniref:COMM domain-containing protein 3 n=1 Tax=Planococcus citri TaxID=170843 RepID=UPI0031F7BF97